MPKKEESEKEKPKKGGRTIYILLLSVIAVALLIIAFKPSSPTGNVVQNPGLEADPFEIRNWKITPSYIEVQIRNNGKNDYNVNEIRIDGCGIGEGGLVSSSDYAGKTFHVVCNNEIESESFSNKAQIIYASFGNGSASQTFTISGDLQKKRCVYDIKGTESPFVSGECEVKWNCMDYLQNLTKKLGVEAKDITIKSCDYV
jgi:hypothetical protein